MVGDLLGQRQLNRATLARQLLLRRSPMSVDEAVTHLVGLQAQVPNDPYVALWSRLEGFDPDELAEGLTARRLVRIVVMRATIHLVTADDCLLLRPLMQPVLDGELERHRDFGPALRGVDVEPVLAFARRLLAEAPRTGTELRAAMAEQFPDLDAAALAFACRNLLAFVQVPPRGVWGQRAQVCSTTAESWLGRPVVANPSMDDVVLRYLGAFGPASVADIATWCRLTKLREVVDRLRPKLRPFRDERGRELVDLPDAPRPDADTPAPVRFLPEYDNVLLSHADRSRFADKEQVGALWATPGPSRGTVLVDGRLRATWRVAGDDEHAALLIEHVGLSKRNTAAVTAEGNRLLGFLGVVAEPRLVDVG